MNNISTNIYLEQAYEELLNELKANINENTEKRAKLYKEKSKNRISFQIGAIDGENWYKKNIELNRKEAELDAQYRKLNGSLYKLTRNQLADY